MSEGEKIEVSVTKLRIESLKGNRNFFTILFTIESAILTAATKVFDNFFIDFFGPIILLSISIILLLFGVFFLTDSVHHYSKKLEYTFMWNDEVHKKLKSSQNKTKEEMVIKVYNRALVSDAFGYYFLKFSLLSFVYFLISFILTAMFPSENIVREFIIITGSITVVAVYCYKKSHIKNWEKAFKGYFIKPNIFLKKSGQQSDELILKSPTSSLYIGTLLGLLLGILGNLFVSLLFEDWINNIWYQSALLVSALFIFGLSAGFWILAKKAANENIQEKSDNN